MDANVRLPFGEVFADCLRVLFRHWRDLPRLIALPTLAMYGLRQLKGLAWAHLAVAYPPQAGGGLDQTFHVASLGVTLIGLLLQCWIVAGVLLGWARVLNGAASGFLVGLSFGRETLRCWILTICIVFTGEALRNAYYLALQLGGPWEADLLNAGGITTLVLWLSYPIALFPVLPLYIGYVMIARDDPARPFAILRWTGGQWWRIAALLLTLMAPVLLVRFLFSELGGIAVYLAGGGAWVLELVGVLLRHYQAAVLLAGVVAVDAWLRSHREGEAA